MAPVNRTRLSTGAPAPFDFVGTALSHGWAGLPPNEWESARARLCRTERLPSGRVVHLEVYGRGSDERPRLVIDVIHRGALKAGEPAHIRHIVRRMFRLDEDLEPFHRLCRRFGGRWQRAARGFGRLLRSPTVFEDAVKTLCTTNIRWGGTRAMVGRLVEFAGEPGPERDRFPAHAFPTPHALARMDERTLGRLRLGYRTSFVQELAERIASGELDLESLLNPGLETDEIRRRLLGLKGFGPYAAANMLMLLGRYDRVTIDSVYRSFVTRRYFPDREPTAFELESVYRDWGTWQYLGYWFDLWQGMEEVV